MHRPLALATLSATLLLLHTSWATAESAFQETDLVSDLAGRAANLDSRLVNPWGIVVGPHGQLRIADNGTGVSTVYSADGTAAAPTITVPPADGGNPTGMVVNRSESDFVVSSGGKSGTSRIIFSSEDGTISAWSPAVDSTLAIKVAATTDGVYKGITLDRNESGTFLLAANFHAGTVDVFDRHFAPVSWAGAFTDATIPEGFAPFDIANLRGRIYVSYAKQNDAKHDDVHGPGNGYLDVFDRDGHLLHRLISQGPLNSPWGMVLAPEGFGRFGHDLLVGNFGDGVINAFDPNTGESRGHLEDSAGNPISIPDLWGLAFARGSRDEGEASVEDGSDDPEESDGGESPTLYFAAGIEDEGHGLVGSLRPLNHDEDREDRHHGPGHGRDGAVGLGVASARANPQHLSNPAGIEFQLSSTPPAIVRLRVYDAAGRLVAEPVHDLSVAGSVVVRWDGTDLRGARVRAGTYFYHVVGGSQEVRGRLVLLP